MLHNTAYTGLRCERNYAVPKVVLYDVEKMMGLRLEVDVDGAIALSFREGVQAEARERVERARRQLKEITGGAPDAAPTGQVAS